MKAIVAEIDKKQMIVVTNKGDFIKVKRQMSAGIGDEIELKTQKTYLAYRRLASMAACLLMCIFLSTGVYAYYTPYSYVSVDINPSIALELNRFERVISVNPLNEDAISMLKDTKSLKNQEIDEALSEIIRSASKKGYINVGIENQVMVVVSAKNSKQEDKLASIVNKATAKELSKVTNNYGITVEKTSIDSYKEALSNKVSPGKQILAGKLREINPEFKDEEISNMSVKEVVQLLKDEKKAVKAAEKDSKGKAKEEHAINNKDKEEQNDKSTTKAAVEAKDNKLKDDKTKPAASIKSNESKNAKEDKIKAAKENKGSADKDSESEAEDKDKNNKDKDDKGIEEETKQKTDKDNNNGNNGH